MLTQPLRRLTVTLPALLTAAVLSSCGSGPLKPGLVKTAAIAPDFSMSERIFFDTPGSAWTRALVGGLVGYGIGNAMQPQEGRALREHVRAEFEKALAEEINKTGRLAIGPAPGADGRLKVNVTQWGFMLKGMSGAFGGETAPVLIARLTLTDAKGKKVWTGMTPKGGIGFQKDVPVHDTGDLRKNIPLMREALTAAARSAARDIASRL